MSHIVVISGHPELKSSVTNQLILSELAKQVDQNQALTLEVRHLDTLYPDFKIDVTAEQAALLKADIVVLQYPFYWYSMPALLKKWIDDVFSFNFAYGPEGDKLKGKHFVASFTIGGPKDSYQPLGYNHFAIEQFMFPIQQLCYLSGMHYQAPVYTHGMVYIPGVYNKLEDVQARAVDHSQRLFTQVLELSQSAENKLKQFVHDWFGQFDILAPSGSYFLRYFAEDAVLLMPEGEFHGHEGFQTWYQNIRQVFKPNCQHLVEQLEVSVDSDAVEGNNHQHYQIEMRIRLIAETFAESSLQGKAVDMQVNETWKVSFDDQGKIKIHHYHVMPL